MKSIKRAPLWGRVGCILSVFLLLTNIGLGVYSRYKYVEFETVNNTLSKTIDKQIVKIENLEKDNENLNVKISQVKAKNKQLKEKISKETTTVSVATTTKTIQPTTKNNQTTSTNDGVNLGSFRISAYCSCSTCCGQWAGGATASGTTPTAGRTIAVDPNVIPLGTKVIIDGHTYVAEDTGSAIKGNRIDMYFDSHSAALNWGIQYRNVSIIK